MADNYIPPRPVGDSAEACYMQAVWDAIWGGALPLIDTPQIQWSRGQKGYIPNVNINPGSGGSGNLQIEICQPDTGETRTYLVRGKDITPA